MLRGKHLAQTVTALVVFILLACVLSGYAGRLVSAIFADPTPAPSGLTERQLYITDKLDHQRAMTLTPLDNRTLVDVTSAPEITIDAFWSTVQASVDGSTLAVTHVTPGSGRHPQPEQITIRIRDVRTGATRVGRTEFHPPVSSVSIALSADGSRLVVEDRDRYSWYILDTANGRVIGSVQTKISCCTRVWIDPTGRRLYRMIRRDAAERERPGALGLAAYDVETGHVIGRLTFDNVLAGAWLMEKPVDDVALFRYWRPGIAQGPNGTRFAVLHAHEDALTVADVETMTVLHSTTLRRPSGLFDWLGLGPPVAHAKAGLGVEWNAAFAPDGQHLFAAGSKNEVEDGAVVTHNYGVRRIDVADGTILAEGLTGERIDWFQPVPDGSALYTFGPRDADEPSDRDSSTYVLRRLDARTLRVTAEREFTGLHRLFLLAASE